MKATPRVIALIILAVVILVVLVFAFMLDGIVKEGVEMVGPKITNVSIDLKSVHIGLLTGSAKVEGLVVGNPEGYKAPNAISVGVAEIGVNPLSILSGKIVVRTLHVISPDITFEGGLGGNNLSKIMDNVEAFSHGGAKSTTKPGAPPAAGQSGKKIQVDDFLVTGAKVHVHLTDLGGKEMTLSLPNIQLKNLGQGNAGLTPAELTAVMLKAVTAATIKAVSSQASDLGKGIEGGATEGLDKIKKGVGGLFGK